MNFDREIALLEEAEAARAKAEALLEKRALPVIDGFLRIGARDKALKFALTLPHCVFKAFMIDHCKHGEPTP